MAVMRSGAAGTSASEGYVTLHKYMLYTQDKVDSCAGLMATLIRSR